MDKKLTIIIIAPTVVYGGVMNPNRNYPEICVWSSADHGSQQRFDRAVADVRMTGNNYCNCPAEKYRWCNWGWVNTCNVF